MSLHSRNGRDAACDTSARLQLSRWINERCPEWTTLLTDHEVARLTRRPRPVLSALVWLGRFPPPARYRGKKLGWHRGEIEQWLATHRASAASRSRKTRCSARAPRKKALGHARSNARAMRPGH